LAAIPIEILRMGKGIVKRFEKYMLNRRHLKLSSLHMLVQDIEMKAGIFLEKVLGGDHGKLYWIGQMNTDGSSFSASGIRRSLVLSWLGWGLL